MYTINGVTHSQDQDPNVLFSIMKEKERIAKERRFTQEFRSDEILEEYTGNILTGLSPDEVKKGKTKLDEMQQIVDSFHGKSSAEIVESEKVGDGIKITEQDILIALAHNGHNLAAVQNELNI